MSREQRYFFFLWVVILTATFLGFAMFLVLLSACPRDSFGFLPYLLYTRHSRDPPMKGGVLRLGADEEEIKNVLGD